MLSCRYGPKSLRTVESMPWGIKGKTGSHSILSIVYLMKWLVSVCEQGSPSLVTSFSPCCSKWEIYSRCVFRLVCLFCVWATQQVFQRVSECISVSAGFSGLLTRAPSYMKIKSLALKWGQQTKDRMVLSTISFPVVPLCQLSSMSTTKQYKSCNEKNAVERQSKQAVLVKYI